VLEVIKNERLQEALVSRGLKNAWVAEQAEIDPAYFSRIKHGRMIATKEERENIAAVIGVSVGDIF